MPEYKSNLSLSALGVATGTTTAGNQTELASDGRGSSTETSMSAFTISGVGYGSVMSDITPNENTSTLATFDFATMGTLFSTRIANRSSNYTYQEVQNGSRFDIVSNPKDTAWITTAYVSSNTTCKYRAKFHDGFNVDISDYDVYKTESFVIQNGR